MVCVFFPLGVLLLDVTGQDILAVNSVLTGGNRSPFLLFISSFPWSFCSLGVGGGLVCSDQLFPSPLEYSNLRPLDSKLWCFTTEVQGTLWWVNKTIVSLQTNVTPLSVSSVYQAALWFLLRRRKSSWDRKQSPSCWLRQAPGLQMSSWLKSDRAKVMLRRHSNTLCM